MSFRTQGRRWLAAAMAVLVGGAAGPVLAQDAGAEAFVVGVAPHTSARVIIEQYQPLRQALEAALSLPVEIRTAPDFTAFARRGLAGEYDIAVTTGHQARLLQTDADYLPLTTYRAAFRSVVVVARDSAVRGTAGLAGTTVIGLSPTSLVTMWGEHLLRERNVPVQVRYVSAADSVAQLILAGDASAGFMSLANFQGLAPEVRERLRFLEESAPMLGRVYMLNPRQAGRQAAVSAALKFFAASEPGQHYFEATKLSGYRDIGVGELESMDPYADQVRRALK